MTKLVAGDHGVVASQVVEGGVSMRGLRQDFGPGNAIDVTKNVWESDRGTRANA